MAGSSFVFWICLFVMLTALPMTIDMLRVFLPRSWLSSGRLVAAWQRPVLLAMVACLCCWAYAAFWPVVHYSHVPFSSQWLVHTFVITLLWINTVWNYASCAALDPGYEKANSAAAAEEQALPQQMQAWSRCKICDQRVLHFDHHCPFTGGCVAANNYRFFMRTQALCLPSLHARAWHSIAVIDAQCWTTLRADRCIAAAQYSCSTASSAAVTRASFRGGRSSSASCGSARRRHSGCGAHRHQTRLRASPWALAPCC